MIVAGQQAAAIVVVCARHCRNEGRSQNTLVVAFQRATSRSQQAAQVVAAPRPRGSSTWLSRSEHLVPAVPAFRRHGRSTGPSWFQASSTHLPCRSTQTTMVVAIQSHRRLSKHGAPPRLQLRVLVLDDGRRRLQLRLTQLYHRQTGCSSGTRGCNFVCGTWL